MSSPDPQPAHQRSSVLQRTVTGLPRADSLSLSEALTGDNELGHPEPSESRLGRTLEDMLCTLPHLRSVEDVAEIEYALTKWSKYGVDLPKPSRLELCKYMGFAAYMAGEVIFKQGDSGDHFYIILSGAVNVAVNQEKQGEKVVAHLLAGAAFGELALMQGHGQRRATCRCTQSTELFTVNIKDFQRILSPLQHGTLQAKITFLKQVPEFQDLPASSIESLAHVLTEKVYPARGVVYYQGNEVEDIFFVQQGHVKLVRELELDRKTRLLFKQPSSVPAWLQSPQGPDAGHALARRRRRALAAKSSQPQPTKSSTGGSRDTACSLSASYHKLSLEIIKKMLGPVHNTNPHSRPSTGSAAEEGQPPAPASARGGRATTPSQSSEEQPCPETPKGNASPLQPFVRLPTDSSEGKLTPLQPAKGQPSAAATQNKVSLAGASVQDGQGALQAAHRAAPGRPGRSQSSSTSLASTKHAAGLTPSGAVTSDRNAATRKACKPGHSSLSSKVSSAGKRAVAGQTRTQDLSGALATISTVHPIAAAVKDNRATTSSAAVSTDTLGLASNKAQSDAQPTYKRQTTFGFDGVEEQLGAASTSQAVILHSEGSFTKQIMQQMSYTGSHEDHNHLFLEVDTLGKYEFFGDVSLTTSPVAPVSAVAADVTAVVLAISKWDLLKRVPKELADHIIARAQNSAINDKDVLDHYREYKEWQRYKQSVVDGVFEERRAARSRNPVQVWKGSFRDEAPIDRHHKAWRPNGTANL